MASFGIDTASSESESDNEQDDVPRYVNSGHIDYSLLRKSTSSSPSSSDSDEPVTKKLKISLDAESPSDKSASATLGKHASMDDMQKMGNYSKFSSRMMEKMGYKPGTGLGRNKQGRVDIVPASKQRARRGLGLKISTLDAEIVVDWEDEKAPSADEVVEWMASYDEDIPDPEELESWEVIGKKKLTIDDETLFCEADILQTMLRCKTVFDELESQEMQNARMRSNPYETIRGGIFLNRAAMKMANMDSCFDFMFTNPKNVHPNELLYFADICAGPGGFSEYILWRRKWRAKGFGFTLKGENDFKLGKFFAGQPEFFEPHYGVGGKDGDGDIMKSRNIEEFQTFVFENSDDKGVHFVLADGGFSVAGQENIQEILTKQLLLCQFACALAIVREDGHFLCKTFDLFTPFSVGLIYLLRIAFKRITLFKPVTSRPANSERYVVCEGYRDKDRIIYQYLMEINDTMNEMQRNDKERDVKEVVPLELLLNDKDFFNYVKSTNERIASEQSKALAKLHAYAKDRNLQEERQHDVRVMCLNTWGIPDEVRVAPSRSDVATVFHNLTGFEDPTSWTTSQPLPLTQDNLQTLERLFNYRCYVSGSRNSIIVGLGGARIFRWHNMRNTWIQLREVNCRLPRDTILDVEIVSELKGEGKGQHRVQSLHVVDALVLAGEDVTQKNFNERIQFASMFVKAIHHASCPNLNVIRMKEIYRLEEMEQIVSKTSLKRVKGAGSVDRVCYSIPNTKLFYLPQCVVVVKFTKDPWSMAFSRTQKRKYFYNCITKQSVFECPPDASASYQQCAESRILWKWQEGVKIHPKQEHRHSDLVSSDQIIQFIRSYLHH